MRELTTDVSHELIGSPAIWDGDTGSGVATRGEGVLVGLLDTGINPDHPSFAATDGDGFTHTNPFGPDMFVGVCDPDTPGQPDEPICNDKLVGAWVFDTRGAFSARDANGHGSHTASTAAGNVHEATFTVGDGSFTRTVQGVAPRANLISYLVCASDCPGTAILAGVDQAVADGVDALNYSISGVDDPWNDPVDLAFLDAFNAGVFVSASAGNGGPGASTVAHTGPWNASVAASSHQRIFAQGLQVTGPAPVPGELAEVPAVPGQDRAVTEPIEAEIRDAATVDPGNGLGCERFPSGGFAGSVALVERGQCLFAEKVNNAALAEAVAVVVVNNVAGPPITMGGLETTTRQSVMIDNQLGEQLRGFVAGQAPVQVRLDPATQLVTDARWANVMAGFSSRGPSRLDLLAPTFTAPGVNILAAGPGGAGSSEEYLVLQGTSMSAPHAAGAGALLAALHPDWTPAQIRAALAATADPEALLREDGQNPAGVFDRGSGLLDLAAAARVGLVLDETAANFAAGRTDPKGLNVPSLVDTQCAQSCSWERTLTNAADTDATYTATVAAPAGVEVTVDPATFTVGPGASQPVTVTAVVADAPHGQWLTGAVGFTTDATHPGSGLPVAGVRYPLAITAIAAPPTLTLDPDQINVTQGADEVSTHSVTLGNHGDAELQWRVAEDEAGDQLRLPYGATTSIETVDPPASSAAAGRGPAVATRPHNGGEAGSALPDLVTPASTGITLTHSRSQTVTFFNSIACADPQTGFTADNGYLRTFTLADFGLTDGFDVSEVSFGVEWLDMEQQVTVNLYTLDTGAEFVYANLTRVGSADTTLEPLPPGAVTMVSVPVTGQIPGDATLVVEVDVPDMTGTGGALFIGSNSAGQTAPSYLRANACGIGEPTDVASLGAGGMHIVMNVTGTPQTACQAPTGTPWAQVDPTSGAIAPGGQQAVTITLDSAGMSDGETVTANLCLVSNDPARPFTVVPLTLRVGEGPGEPPAASQEIVATVPGQPGEGSLIISVDPNDRTVTLPELQLAGTGDRLATSGELRPVTVTDTRAATNPGWDASAQVSEFSAGGESFGGGFLGWSPQVASSSEGQTVTPGAPVAPGFPTGDGLSAPQTLGTTLAGAGAGTAVLGAGLALQVPVTTPPGTYTAVLTLTAI